MKPPTFIQFLDEFPKPKLTPGQFAWLRVKRDGLDPCDLTGAEREAARTVWGPIEKIPPEARGVSIDNFGRGSGKTAFAAWGHDYRMITADLHMLGPGEPAFCINIAPDKRTGRQMLRFAIGLFKQHASLARLVEAEGHDFFSIRRPQDKRLVVFEVLPSSRGGAAGRGRSILEATLDEADFHRDADGYEINDEATFNGLAPRILPGGMISLISTPWLGNGLFGKEFRRNYAHPVSAMAARGPTSLMRAGDPTIEAIIRREFERDAETARIELGAEDFVSAGSAAFFDGFALSMCSDPNLPLEISL